MPPGEAELQLRRCLDARTRRWAAAEFFYSAVDRPWFMQNELKVGRSIRDSVICMKRAGGMGLGSLPVAHAL